MLFDGQRVLFLGDDDLVSVGLAAVADVSVTVIEVDGRIVEVMKGWAARLNLRDFKILHQDIRDDVDVKFSNNDAFHLNPPYSKKNGGHGLRYWISRAVDLCVPDCHGVVAMPADHSLDWVNSNWLSVQRFVTDNGFRIAAGPPIGHLYDAVNDKGLASTNMHLERVNSALRSVEPSRVGSAIYR